MSFLRNFCGCGLCQRSEGSFQQVRSPKVSFCAHCHPAMSIICSSSCFHRNPRRYRSDNKGLAGSLGADAAALTACIRNPSEDRDVRIPANCHRHRHPESLPRIRPDGKDFLSSHAGIRAWKACFVRHSDPHQTGVPLRRVRRMRIAWPETEASVHNTCICTPFSTDLTDCGLLSLCLFQTGGASY